MPSSLSTIATYGLLASLTTASVISKPAPIKSITVTDTFDNTTTLIPGTNAIGYQNNLIYKDFGIANGPSSDVQRASPPNGALVNLETNLLLDTSVNLNPTATAVKSAAIQYFSLDHFYFGCAGTLGQAAANVATGCDVSVTAYNTQGKMVGSAAFNFAPQTLNNAKMARAVLPLAFAGLVNFTIGISASTLPVSVTSLIVDNVTRTNYW